MASRDDIERILAEQALMKDAVEHPGFKLLAAKLKAEARKSLKRQLDADPYINPDEIQKNKQFRFVITVMLPGIIEGLVNYDPAAPDKQVPPKKRWTVFEWFRQK